METLNVPEGVLTSEWQKLDVPGVPSKQPTDLRLNGEPIPSGAEAMLWPQAIQ